MAERAAAPPAAAMAAASTDLDLPPEVLNLALVLDALNDETGTNGGTAAEDRVKLFRDKRGDVDASTFGFVSSLPIRHWYASAFDRPNDEERKSLWFAVRDLMHRPQVPNPGGWDGASPTDDLRLIAQRTQP